MFTQPLGHNSCKLIQNDQCNLGIWNIIESWWINWDYINILNFTQYPKSRLSFKIYSEFGHYVNVWIFGRYFYIWFFVVNIWYFDAMMKFCQYSNDLVRNIFILSIFMILAIFWVFENILNFQTIVISLILWALMKIKFFVLVCFFFLKK